MLDVRGLSAGYGGLGVLRSLDLEVRRGEWLALLGPVGAGKSTLLGALAGLVPLRHGEIRLDGEAIESLPPQERLRRGLALVLELFPVLAERSRQIAGTLSGGEQQMCAIGRALMASPRLLMVDEVTLGLAPMIVRPLFAALSQLRRQGVTLLTVEQNVPIALAHADRGCVLNAGAIVMAGSAAALRDDPDLPRRFLGY